MQAAGFALPVVRLAVQAQRAPVREPRRLHVAAAHGHLALQVQGAGEVD
ncbi:hypothetical protein [Chondromyces apiculatus]|nr:hypothetical protein [Chondromyces apiculatus]